MQLFPHFFEKRVSADKVGRFIFSSKHFSSSEKRAKPAAFLPPPKDQELSVYQNSLEIGEMFHVGDNFVGACRSPLRKVKAFAILDVGRIESVELDPKLEVLSWPKPHYLHANIKPFPLDKAQQRHIAHILSEKASVELRV